jgi:hypothetical protein
MKAPKHVTLFTYYAFNNGKFTNEITKNLLMKFSIGLLLQ